MRKYWKKLPVWLRKTIVGTAETAVVAVLVYSIAVLEGNVAYSSNIVLTIVIKAILQGFRTNPDIPIEDYVNNQK